MQTIPRPLFVLHADQGFRTRIRKVGQSEFEVRFAESWAELEEAACAAPPSAVVVVDPYFASDDVLATELRTLLLKFPSLPIVAAATVRRGRYHDVRTLGEWGVVDLISQAEENSATAIRRRLLDTRGRRLQTRLSDILPPAISGWSRSLLMAAAETATMGGQSQEFAAVLKLGPRTLLRWCDRAMLPPPRRLLAWMRVLLAAELLDDPGRTVLSVAAACGYSSDNSLRRALMDFLETTPTQLRDRGAFDVAAQRFVRELLAVRESAGGQQAG